MNMQLWGHTASVLFVLVTVLMCFWLLHFKEKFKYKSAAVVPLAFFSMAVGVLCLKLFAVVEAPGDPTAITRFSLFGFVFFMPIAFWIGAKITKRKFPDVLDAFSLPMISALVCARVNCLVTGCCIGRAISGTNGLRWPTREAEIIYYLIFVGYFAPKVWKGKTKGEVYPWYMLTYGVLRFVLETFRYSDAGTIFHLSHFWAIISFCIGLTFVIELRENKKRRK